MQNRINLSIQFPMIKAHCFIHTQIHGMATHLLKLLFGYLLVDCYKTKSMYILPYSEYKNFENIIKKKDKL